MLDNFICPECRGWGVAMDDGGDGSDARICWFCDGIGLASDEAMEQNFYHYED